MPFGLGQRGCFGKSLAVSRRSTCVILLPSIRRTDQVFANPVFADPGDETLLVPYDWQFFLRTCPRGHG